jgi:CelD/BcsL family acetyltransferase involved in cellulose biosynthesis
LTTLPFEYFAPAETFVPSVGEALPTTPERGPSLAWPSNRCVEHPIEHPAWIDVALRTVHPDGVPRLIVDGESESCRAMAPLVLETVRGVKRLRAIGVDTLAEPMDFVFAKRAALEKLVKRVVGLGIPLDLARVPADSPTIELLKAACAGRAAVVVRPREATPFVALSPAWREPESQLTSRRRGDLARARRRAEEFGPIECRIETPTPENFDRLFDRACAIEARSWKGRVGSALALDPLRATFYRHYGRLSTRAGQFRFAWLRYGNELVAMQMAIEVGQRYWLLKIGYDEQFARTSPGIMLVADTLRLCAERELSTYEFLGTNADWIRAFTADERPTVSVRTYPYSPVGMTAACNDGLRTLVAKLSRWRR